MAARPAAMAARLNDASGREGGREATGERLRPLRLVMTPGEGERRAESATVETSFI